MRRRLAFGEKTNKGREKRQSNSNSPRRRSARLEQTAADDCRDSRASNSDELSADVAEESSGPCSNNGCSGAFVNSILGNPCRGNNVVHCWLSLFLD